MVSLLVRRALVVLSLGAVGVAALPSSALAQTRTERKKVSDAMGATLDYFGNASATDGERVIVGAHNSGTKGAAFIYERNLGGSNNWGLRKKLVAPDGEAFDAFGLTVAIRGDVAVVGTYLDSVAATNSGSAYVFERNQGGTDNWGFVKKLTAFDAAQTDYFGGAAAVEGDLIFVSAPYDDNEGSQSGSIYIFKRDVGGPGNWGFVKKLTAGDGAIDDQLGWAMSLDGDTLGVSAHRDDNPGMDAGSAYIFERNAGGTDNWGQVKKLSAFDASPMDLFGYGIALSGNTVIVGAEGDADNGASSGSAYVFERNAGGAENWGFARKLNPAGAGPGDYFGYAIGLSGNTAVISAPFSSIVKSGAGAAFVFVRDQGGAGQWGQAAMLISSDLDYNDSFGFSAKAAGDVCVIGASADDDHGDGSGSAYVFDGLAALGLSGDCNGNDTPDIVDIFVNHTSEDCNGNGIPDECDIASGFSQDSDVDGVPDECGMAALCPPGDVDGDHVVTVFDFGILASYFGYECDE